MPDIIQTLLRAGITAGLSNRDAFVKEISGIITEYRKNPEQAENWAKIIADYLEGVRDNINMQQAIKSAVSGTSLPRKEQIEKLTLAIENLAKQLEQSNKK